MEAGLVMSLSPRPRPRSLRRRLQPPVTSAMGMTRTSTSSPTGPTPVTVGLGETDATHMFLDLSQAYAPEGAGPRSSSRTKELEDHEFVGAAEPTRPPRFPHHRVRGRAGPVQRRRQGDHERRGDRRSRDEARHLDDAHDRHDVGPLRARMQPERPLRHGDAPGLLRDPEGFHPGDGLLGRDRRHPHVRRPVAVLRARGQGLVHHHEPRSTSITSSSRCRPTRPPRISPSPGSRSEPDRFDEDAMGLATSGDSGLSR